MNEFILILISDQKSRYSKEVFQKIEKIDWKDKFWIKIFDKKKIKTEQFEKIK